MRAATPVSDRIPRARSTTSDLLYLGAIAHLVIWAVCLVTPEGHLGDFHRYWEIATTAGGSDAPAPVEYPPGAVLAFRALAGFAGASGGFAAALLVLNLAADALITAVLADGWGIAAGAAYLVLSAPLASLLFFRFDLWSVAAATAAVACWRRGRRGQGAALLTLGVALKLWPLPLVAWLAARPQPASRRTRSWLWPVLVCLVVVGAWIAADGVAELFAVLSFRGATGWGIESTIGSVWRLVRPESIRLEAGAVRVGTIAPLASVALLLAGLPIAWWAIHRGTATCRVGLGWVTGLGALLTGSALLSPQFLAWLLPGAAMAWAEEDRRTTAWMAVLIVATVAYRILHTTQMPGLVLLRNALLIAMVSDGLWRLRARLLAKPPQDGPIVRLEPADPPAA